MLLENVSFCKCSTFNSVTVMKEISSITQSIAKFWKSIWTQKNLNFLLVGKILDNMTVINSMKVHCYLFHWIVEMIAEASISDMYVKSCKTIKICEREGFKDAAENYLGSIEFIILLFSRHWKTKFYFVLYVSVFREITDLGGGNGRVHGEKIKKTKKFFNGCWKTQSMYFILLMSICNSNSCFQASL